MTVLTRRDQFSDSSIITPRNRASYLRSMTVLEITKGDDNSVLLDLENNHIFSLN